MYERKDLSGKITTERIIGGIFIFSGLVTFSGISVIEFIIGGVLLYCAHQNNKMQTLYSKYATILYSIDDLSIQNISYRMGKDPMQVRKDIEFLIEKNCLGNAVLDAYDDKLVFANTSHSQNSRSRTYTKKVKNIKVVCPGCNQ